MHRQITLQVKTSDSVEEYLEDEIETLEDAADDPASTSFPSTPAFTAVMEQYVVFSPTYQVPGFMFNAYDSGTQLHLVFFCRITSIDHSRRDAHHS